MLKRLTLRDFVIVDALEVDFGNGFCVLTGETGAGKSILIDALQLALGGRGEAGVVREGAARTEIGAEFEPVPAALHGWLDEAGFASDDSVLLLRRTVDAQGKSRAWINGSPATLTQLRELGEQLVDIHGQHAWQSLTRPASVRALLDAYAGADTAALGKAWAEWRAQQGLLDAARARGDELARERERLAWQIGELAKLAPGEDEWPDLNGEHQRLAHAQGILDAAQLALQLCSESDESAGTLVDRAIDAIDGVAGYDATLGNALEVLRGVRDQLSDAAHSLNAALRRTELDPERLAEVDARMSAWMGLARRYRRPPEELAATLAGWQAELRQLDAATDLEALEQAAARSHARVLAEARTVTALRRQAAPKLSDAVSAAMQTLGMSGGRFEVVLEPLAEVQAHGLEAAEFRVAGHAGSTPRPLGKVASGGELSRIALAIAVTTSQLRMDQGEAVGTLIFDEIDSGVGGAVAETVGRLMRQLGAQRQVLAVTHLAQVAACAQQHLVVSKAARDGRTLSRIAPVAGEARVAEIARMLGGQQLSGAGLAHAQEMLSAAGRKT
ncbi:DNA repair protein RecN [Leptothrix discophora]|uniref:DNA repair protein RecN n=1 Tax=Leptothrix discophora TaxID=89 RepID=A0ABT9G4E0_LEPDI|nr:DNA repair protein RecN [Leptothrix discophora]MDP4301355.1 DNA repair protein RecN [Leptothrix discophora]